MELKSRDFFFFFFFSFLWEVKNQKDDYIRKNREDGSAKCCTVLS